MAYVSQIAALCLCYVSCYTSHGTDLSQDGFRASYGVQIKDRGYMYCSARCAARARRAFHCSAACPAFLRCGDMQPDDMLSRMRLCASMRSAACSRPQLLRVRQSSESVMAAMIARKCAGCRA